MLIVSEGCFCCVQEVSIVDSVGDSPVSWVVVAMATSSLLSMVCLFQLDRIVEVGLSSGLHASFSTIIQIGLVLGWFNIVAAIGVHLYSVTFRRKELEQLVKAAEVERRRRELEELRGFEEPPILPWLSEQDFVFKSEAELEREKEVLVAAA